MPADQAQRSEQPTPRRKQKAREEGQVPSSREFTSSIQFGAAVLMLWVWGGDVAVGMERAAVGLFREAFRGGVDVERLRGVVLALGTDALLFGSIYASVLLVLGVLVHMGQTGFAFTLKRLTPDFNRLNPKQRLSEMPGENLSQLLKALVMLPIVGVVFWYIVRDELDGFLRLPKISFELGTAFLMETLLELLAKAAVVLVALGVFDLYRQRRKIHKKLMMTKQEIRQEQKDLEGNPQIKAKLRRLQREMMRRRMMSEVPTATVVVTNPTHYAVAMRYVPESMPAPVVVAMGLDHVALRMRSDRGGTQDPDRGESAVGAGSLQER